MIIKMVKIVISIAALILLGALFSCAEENNIEVINLKCEYLTHPLGVDVVKPRLSWQLKTEKYNVKQKAYRIIASSNLKKLELNNGDLWDTDTVISDQSTHVPYNGRELKSRDKIFWKVKVWDDNNNSQWSEVASWEMGLLDQSDWNAKWIGRENYHHNIGEKKPALYFRKEFHLKDNVENARVYVSGLGYYELYINGTKVSDHVLAPNQTNYDRRQADSFEKGRIANMSTRVLYEIFNITNYLQEGENVAAVILGNGWYYQTEREEYLPVYFDTPRFITQIEMDYSDSSRQLIVSDGSWKVSTGPIVDNNLFFGEVYDARLEMEGWDHLGFDDSNWVNSEIVRSPEGKLGVQMSPPDRVTGIIKPVEISHSHAGITRFDFGTMFSGWVKLKIRGKRGEQIKLTFFEDSGNNYEQSDTYILKGEGIEEWEPRFTWHAFRFVHVSGSSMPLTLESLEGRVVNTHVNRAGNFNSSNDLFNRILFDYQKTQLGNMHGGVPSDCPHRERRGYTGDGQISAQAAIYNFDMKSFYTKWLSDISDAQNKQTGYVPNTVPYHGGGGGTPWGSAYIIISWYMYLYYGDVTILEEHYEGMKKYLSYLNSRTDNDGLIIEDELGEWVPPAITEIPPSLVSSAYYYYDLTLISKIAEILKKGDDIIVFSKIASETKKSFNKRFYKPEEFSYSIGRQGANVFPLAFGLVPEEFENKVFETLVHNVEVNTKGHFDTGMMGTPYLLEVLTKYGRPDLAYTLMNRRDFPSYGYNIERGATTLWETWTGNDSHSHPMFGSVCEWFYKGLGGINPDPQNPSFRHIIIKPYIVDELDFVNTSYPSQYGEISSSWELKNRELKLHVTIPPNTTASVYVPGKSKDFVSADNPNISYISKKEHTLHYEVSSGVYTFVSRNIHELLRTPMLSIPVIDPPDSILFVPDSVLIKIRQYSKNAEIRFTLDGTVPDQKSLLYTGPFKIDKSTVIKAQVFREGSKPGYVKTNRVIFIDSLNNGLDYEYYLGAWDRLPDFNKMKPNCRGKIIDIDLNLFEKLDDKFAIIFSGELDIKTDGDYTFHLSSNDGSRLFINNKEVVNIDGLHSFSGKSGTINLKQGRQKIKLEYFQAGGGKGLELLYEGPEIENQKIPADIFFFNKK